MPTNAPPGLFITGTDTGVGKTYVGALITRSLVVLGLRVGVYKPAASGCRTDGKRLSCDDAVQLWEAAGRPGELDQVCPQCFAAPTAPHLAARAEGKALDAKLLRDGIEVWRQQSDVIVVEGAGGLMSPLGRTEYVADLAGDLGYPLVIVSPNKLGTINATLQTLIAARTFRGGLPIAGIVLNTPTSDPEDSSRATNRRELAERCVAPILAGVDTNAEGFDTAVDWFSLARNSHDG